jgi:DNA processing protein
MTGGDSPTPLRAACARCLRRSWLLAELSGPLDCNCRSDGRLFELLELDDHDLIEALAGRRRETLREQHDGFRQDELPRAGGMGEICRHRPSYPSRLHVRMAPAMLFASGGLDRLARLTTQPVVAIVGSGRATDYGTEIARALARSLAASGVTVAGTLSEAVGRAAQAGVLEAGGAPLSVLGGGLDVRAPAHSRALRASIMREGTAVSELPCRCGFRRWSTRATVRTVAALATVTVVVEAENSVRGLECARVAQTLGRTVAAVPGRVSSPASCASHALLREGAHLITGPGDVLELLCHAGPAAAPSDPLAHLEPRLLAVLESVGAGLDTPQRLSGNAREPGDLLHALSELELMGLLARGDGGRYVARTALGRRGVR